MQSSAILKSGLILYTLFTVVGSVRQNLLENPSFEEPLADVWRCDYNRCAWNRSDVTANSGAYSVKVFDRINRGYGLKGKVTEGIKPSTPYYVSGYIKLFNQVALYHKLEIFVTTFGASARKFNVARVQFIRECDDWVQIGGDFVTTDDTTSVEILLLVTDDMQVDYYLDDVSLYEIERDPDWEQHANTRINNFRRGTVTINVEVKDPLKANDISFYVNQTATHFPIGVAIDAFRMHQTDATNVNYQNYVYDLFNWYTFTNDVKWRIMERREGNPKFDNILKGLYAMAERNKTNIRGHCVVWGRENKIVSWLKDKDSDDIVANIQRRINYLADNFDHRFSHWDMNNENMHGHWYEEHTDNFRFSQDLFHELYSKNTGAQLFINDFYALSGELFTSSYKRMGSSFVEQGVPIYGMGVQSHISGGNWIDVDRYKHRLDLLSTTGLPIWITELDIRKQFNTTIRATMMRDVLRLYMSHPTVAGIILWIFWDQGHPHPEASIVDGNNFVENEVGCTIRKLLKQDWSTNVEIHLVDGDPIMTSTGAYSVKFKAFYGDFDLQVIHQGQVLGEHNFVHKKAEKTEINLLVDEDGVHDIDK